MGAVEQVHPALQGTRPHSGMAIAAEHSCKRGPRGRQLRAAGGLAKLQVKDEHLHAACALSPGPAAGGFETQCRQGPVRAAVQVRWSADWGCHSLCSERLCKCVCVQLMHPAQKPAGQQAALAQGWLVLHSSAQRSVTCQLGQAAHLPGHQHEQQVGSRAEAATHALASLDANLGPWCRVQDTTLHAMTWLSAAGP